MADTYKHPEVPSHIGTMTVRAFISVDLERDERIEAFAAELKSADPTLKVVDPSQIHVTLKFLGDTDETDLPKITDIMREAVKGVPPFTIALRGAGAFPSKNRIRVVWVGMNDTLPMATIAGRLDEGLAKLGVAREARPFAPHLTIARTRAEGPHPVVRQLIENKVEADMGTQPVAGVRLKKSVLTQCGPQYFTLAEASLEG